MYFCRHCGTGFAPLDQAFNLFKERNITKEMAEEIAYSAQDKLSFESAARNIKRYLKIEVSESLIREVAEEIGETVYENDREKAEKAFKEPEKAIPEVSERSKKEGVLYISCDGSMVNTISQDKAGSTWREMKLGLVYLDRNTIHRKDGKSIITEKEYVSHFGVAEQFKKLLFAAAIDMGYGTIKEIVFIRDGAHWIWNMCAEIFPDAVQILDYYHLSENVYSFAKYLYPNDSQKINIYANEMLDKIKGGAIEEVLNILLDMKAKDLPTGVPNLKAYLTNNRHRIKYSEFEKKGYQIGSGAIESGNKAVIKQRLNQPGMRWSLVGGQYIAALRAKSASAQWSKVISAIAA